MSGEPKRGARRIGNVAALLLLMLASDSHARAEGSYDRLLAPASLEETLNEAPEEQFVPTSLLLGGDDSDARDQATPAEEESQPNPAKRRLPYRRFFSGAYDALGDSEPDAAQFDSASANLFGAPSASDDLNGNNINGSVFVVNDLNGDGIIMDDEVVGELHGFGDLQTSSVFFDDVSGKTQKLGGFASFELTYSKVLNAPTTLARGWRFDGYLDRGHVAFGDEVAPLSASDESASGWRSAWYTTTGIRAYSYESQFEFEGLGSILGRVAIEQTNDHFVLGPQLGIGYVAERSIWRFEAKLLGLVGYGHLDAQQQGVFGEELIPGALNRPGSARITRTSAEASDDYFAWHGEARLGVGCQVTKRIRADVTYRYMVLGPTYIADSSVVWNLPAVLSDAGWGIDVPKGETVDAHSLFVGASYVW